METNLFVEKLKKGDRQALEQLVLDYKDDVFRTCLAYLQSYHDAEDLTQEVFLKVIDKIKGFKGQSKLSSWMMRIAINMAINYLRDNKKRLNQLEVSELHLLSSDQDGKFNHETKKMVRKAVYKLPEKQKKVFVLSFYLEYSYKEIEEITGFSISSIESLLFRSRKKLKDLLQDYYTEHVLNAN